MSFQMTSGLVPDLLDDEQKTWLATAICGAVMSDGAIAPEEVEFLERAISFMDSQAQIDSLLQAVKDQKLPEQGNFPNGSREVEAQIFIELTLVISVDNVLGTREIDYLLEVAKKLGFGTEFVRVLIRWAGEGIVWKRKMQHLIDGAEELEPEYA